MSRPGSGARFGSGPGPVAGCRSLALPRRFAVVESLRVLTGPSPYPAAYASRPDAQILCVMGLRAVRRHLLSAYTPFRPASRGPPAVFVVWLRLIFFLIRAHLREACLFPAPRRERSISCRHLRCFLYASPSDFYTAFLLSSLNRHYVCVCPLAGSVVLRFGLRSLLVQNQHVQLGQRSLTILYSVLVLLLL